MELQRRRRRLFRLITRNSAGRCRARIRRVLDKDPEQFNALTGVIAARLTSVEHSVSSLRATIVGTWIGVVAVVIAVMAYGQAWFGSGLATRDLVRAVVSEYHQQTVPPPNAPPVK